MARKRVLISGAGGIAAGLPFVLGQGLIVGQVSPAFAISARFGQAADAMLSFVAPDVSGGADSFVLGEGSTSRGAPQTVIVGDNFLQSGNATSTRFVGLGGNYDPGAATPNVNDMIVIGWNSGVTAPGTPGGNLILIGDAVLLTTVAAVSNGVAIGHAAVLTGNTATAVGIGAQAGAESVSIGQGARTNLISQSVAIGAAADARTGNAAVAVGQASKATGAGAIAIGKGAQAQAASSVVMGHSATDGLFADCIILGRGSAPDKAFDLVIGGDPTHPIKVMRVGPLFDSTYVGLAWQLTHSDFAGANVVAPNFTLKGGTNTGNAAGGEIRVQTAVIVGAGAARQVLAERVAVLPSTGAAGAAILRFSNYTDGAGIGAGTLLNAPVAGNPNAWIPILDGTGAVRHVPAW